MKRLIITILLCLLFVVVACNNEVAPPAEVAPSACDQARSQLDNAKSLQMQAEEELNQAKQEDTTLGIPNIRDSEEVKQARVKLATASLYVDELDKQVQAACKQ